MSYKLLVWLSAALGLTLTIPGRAQEIDKPRPALNERLPAPAKITAAQQPDGSIRVIWSAVDGAERYALTRSVPPTAAAPVSLPNPADTSYVDRDVKSGSTYYYLIAAINSAGLTGLKASAPPVKAEALVADEPTSPPRGITAALYGTRAEISWSPMQSIDGYRIERGVVVENRPLSWVMVVERNPCCRARDELNTYPGGTRIRYRVSAVSRTLFTSPPGVSNEIIIPAGSSRDTLGTDTATADTPRDTAGPGPADTTAGQADTATATPRTDVRPSVIAEASRMRVGDPALRLGKTASFTSLRLRQPRWLSLNEAVATVDAEGRVRARSPGFTHIVAIGVTPQGSIASMVKRVDVAAR